MSVYLFYFKTIYKLLLKASDNFLNNINEELSILIRQQLTPFWYNFVFISSLSRHKSDCNSF